VFVSKPVIGRLTGKWSIQVSPPDHAPGRFVRRRGGRLRRPELSRGVLRFRGSRRQRRDRPARDGWSGAGATRQCRGASRHDPPGKPDGDAAARDPAGTLVSLSPIDGIERIYSYRRVRDYPLLVAVGLERAAVLESHLRNRSFAVVWPAC